MIGFVERPALGLDLPPDVRGTAFQQRVWAALRQIPIDSTVSYAEIASRIGAPNGALHEYRRRIDRVHCGPEKRGCLI